MDIRLNEDGTLDEIFAKDATVHLEQMGPDGWWLGIDVGKRHISVWLSTTRGEAVPDDTDDPDCGPVIHVNYEDHTR